MPGEKKTMQLWEFSLTKVEAAGQYNVKWRGPVARHREAALVLHDTTVEESSYQQRMVQEVGT